MHRVARNSSFVAILSLVLAITTGLARTEKIWAQNLNDIGEGPLTAHLPAGQGHAPFDPSRVPSSGGGASRLLAGIVIKHA